MLRAAITTAFVALANAAEAAVEITGIEGEPLENLREFIQDQPPCDVAPLAVERFAAALPERVQPALEAFGYYDATVEVRSAPPADECWQLTAVVMPGEPVVVRSTDVEILGAARDDPAFEMLESNFPLPQGSRLRHGEYRTFKDRLETLARQRGYLDARVMEERIDVYPEEHAAAITLTFDSGSRYAFGEVSFDTVAVNADVLEHFVEFEPGQPYDASLIADLQRELVTSDYFREVRVVPQFEATAENHIPIRIETISAETTSYSVGAGFSTDDGPRFSFAYENTLRNSAGHQWNTDVMLAQVRQNATFDYRIPVGNPQRDWLSIRAGVEREDLDAGVGSSARFGLRRVHVADALTVTRFIDVLAERDDLGSGPFTTRLLLPGMSWARSYRDDLLRPREGHRFSANVMLGVGDISLLQTDLSAKWIRATPWNARLILRGRLGVTLEDDAFNEMPLSLRFFAGGDNSIRGYDYESLGPRAPDGSLIGGNRLIEASVEYEHPILETWGAAVFVDAGNAFLDSDFKARVGAGVGARWFSPIGPVRIDVAWPLDTAPDESTTPELHISLGPDL